MASGSLRIPPPPVFAKSDPAFNRWLLEVTAILAAAGGIDPTQIDGWNALVQQVATNTQDIDAAEGAILGLSNQVNSLSGSVTLLQGTVNALAARSQILNGNGAPSSGLGNGGDLYINNTGVAGSRLYGKIGAAWVAIA